jgi:AraC-like DNA-binding protein
VRTGYRELRPPAGLEPIVACLWENSTATGREQRIVPDGCLDLIWTGDRELVIAGADTGPRSVELAAGSRSLGVRLRPGAAGAALGLPASELRDRTIGAGVVLGAPGEELGARLAAGAPGERLGMLAAAFKARSSRPDRIVRAAARLLSLPRARVAHVAGELGVSERQLRRRTLDAVGYGPKTLARVARLRRLIALPGDEPLVARAFDAGYASQSHMSEEVRRLTGATPVRFLEDAVLTAA